MKKEYDFSKGVRGALIPTPGKTRITIHIDDDILEWFREQVRKKRGGLYTNLMNDGLRAFIESKGGLMEEMVRRVVREELATHSAKKKRKPA